MKTGMTNNEMVILYNTITNLKVNSGIKFKYAIAKNVTNLKSMVEDLNKSIVYPDPFNQAEEYNKKAGALFEIYAVDEEGNPNYSEINGQVKRTIPLFNQAAFKAESDALLKEYKELAADVKRHNKEVDALMKENIKIDLYTISLELVPENEFSQQEVNILYPLFVESE